LITESNPRKPLSFLVGTIRVELMTPTVSGVKDDLKQFEITRNICFKIGHT